jgi:hypothetical protein
MALEDTGKFQPGVSCGVFELDFATQEI